MKAGTDRTYTLDFHDASVKQVIESGRGNSEAALSLEMSSKTLANSVYRARKGQAWVKRLATKPISKPRSASSSAYLISLSVPSPRAYFTSKSGSHVPINGKASNSSSTSSSSPRKGSAAR